MRVAVQRDVGVAEAREQVVVEPPHRPGRVAVVHGRGDRRASDLQPWVDYNNAQTVLFNGSVTTEQWQQLAVSGTIWFLIPLAVGLFIVRRSEVM